MAGLVPTGVVVPSTSAAAAGGTLAAKGGGQNGGGSSAAATSAIVSVNQRSVSASSLHRYSSERIPSRRFNAGAAVHPIACAASVNEVVVENHVGTSAKLGKASDPKQTEGATESSSESSISAFLKDVTDLVKLVDSKDIVELELKCNEYEIVIKKESPQLPASPFSGPSPGPQVMAHTSLPGYAPPLPSGPPPPQAPTSAPAPTDSAPAAAEAPPPPPPMPSHPPMLSPMAGTFYRSPGPGEPAFVQVGDKVRKGQVVCIVEAMKLMNEIETDQSGTVVEILAEDGKPISIESPLFSIKP